jgi:hypothetical protein
MGGAQRYPSHRYVRKVMGFARLNPSYVCPSLPATNAKRLRKGVKRRSNPFFLHASKWIASLALAMTLLKLSSILRGYRIASQTRSASATQSHTAKTLTTIFTAAIFCGAPQLRHGLNVLIAAIGVPHLAQKFIMAHGPILRAAGSGAWSESRKSRR